MSRAGDRFRTRIVTLASLPAAPAPVKPIRAALDARKQSGNQSEKTLLDALRRLHHFPVRQRLRQNAGGHVADAGNARHFEPRVARRDHFGHRAHADRVRAEGAQHANFGRRFIGRTQKPRIHAADETKALLFRHGARQFAQSGAVRLRHVGKARPDRLVVGADERILARQVEVILDQHQIARLKRRVDAAGGVRHHQRMHAERLHDAHGKRHRLGGISFIQVESPVHQQDGASGGLADDEFARVSRHRRHRKVRNFAIRNRRRAFHRLRQHAESGAENQPDLRARVRPAANPRRGLFHLFFRPLHIHRTTASPSA